MLAPALITAPTDTPVSVEDAVAHVNAQGAGDDTIIEAFLNAAVERLDGHTGILGRALVTQTWRQDFPGFADRLRLPLATVASITHVKYYDGNNTLQTLSSTVYSLFKDGAGPYIELAPAQSWPGCYSRPDAVQVTFVCGSAVASVPAPIKAAILLMVGDLYAFRETAQVGSTAAAAIPMSMTVSALIAPYRRVGV